MLFVRSKFGLCSHQRLRWEQNHRECLPPSAYITSGRILLQLFDNKMDFVASVEESLFKCSRSDRIDRLIDGACMEYQLFPQCMGATCSGTVCYTVSDDPVDAYLAEALEQQKKYRVAILSLCSLAFVVVGIILLQQYFQAEKENKQIAQERQDAKVTDMMNPMSQAKKMSMKRDKSGPEIPFDQLVLHDDWDGTAPTLKPSIEHDPGITKDVEEQLEMPSGFLNRVLLLNEGERVVANFDVMFPQKMIPTWKIILLLIFTLGLYGIVLLYRFIERMCWRAKICTPSLVEFHRGKMVITTHGRIICWSETCHQAKIHPHPICTFLCWCFCPIQMCIWRLCLCFCRETCQAHVDYQIINDTRIYNAKDVREISQFVNSKSLFLCCCLKYTAGIEIAFNDFDHGSNHVQADHHDSLFKTFFVVILCLLLIGSYDYLLLFLFLLSCAVWAPFFMPNIFILLVTLSIVMQGHPPITVQSLVTQDTLSYLVDIYVPGKLFQLKLLSH